MCVLVFHLMFSCVRVRTAERCQRVLRAICRVMYDPVKVASLSLCLSDLCYNTRHNPNAAVCVSRSVQRVNRRACKTGRLKSEGNWLSQKLQKKKEKKRSQDELYSWLLRIPAMTDVCFSRRRTLILSPSSSSPSSLCALSSPSSSTTSTCAPLRGCSWRGCTSTAC